MKKLQSHDVVRIMCEEYARKLKALTEKIDISVVSSGLKVRDTNNNQFTVTRVGDWGVELSYVTSDNLTKYKRVDKKEFEENYMTPAEARQDDNKKENNDG